MTVDQLKTALNSLDGDMQVCILDRREEEFCVVESAEMVDSTQWPMWFHRRRQRDIPSKFIVLRIN